jgi:hypothetical protein
MMPGMRFGDWIRRLFSSSGTDDEAAQREEYGVPDRGEAELERDRLGRTLAESEGAEAAQAGLDELKPPRDPAP